VSHTVKSDTYSKECHSKVSIVEQGDTYSEEWHLQGSVTVKWHS